MTEEELQGRSGLTARAHMGVLTRRKMSTGSVKASPAARVIAARHGLDLAVITATGPKSYITKSDVVAAVAAGPVAIKAPAVVTQAPVQSELPVVTGNPKAEVPHYYLSVDLNMGALLETSKQFEAVGAEGNFVEAFIVKASAVATRAVPEANSAWMPTATRMWNDVNIQCRGSDATYTIPSADKQAVRTLAAAAKSGTDGGVTPTVTVDFLDDLAFARTFVGHGQSVILTVGQPRQTTALANGELKAETVLTATLTCDHRTVDGAVGAAWLQEFRKVFESPNVLLI